MDTSNSLPYKAWFSISLYNCYFKNTSSPLKTSYNFQVMFWLVNTYRMMDLDSPHLHRACTVFPGEPSMFYAISHWVMMFIICIRESLFHVLLPLVAFHPSWLFTVDFSSYAIFLLGLFFFRQHFHYSCGVSQWQLRRELLFTDAIAG